MMNLKHQRLKKSNDDEVKSMYGCNVRDGGKDISDAIIEAVLSPQRSTTKGIQRHKKTRRNLCLLDSKPSNCRIAICAMLTNVQSSFLELIASPSLLRHFFFTTYFQLLCA